MPTETGTPAVTEEAPGLPAKEPVVMDAAPDFYLGCWMSGDGLGISISNSAIQTTKNARPLRYRDVTDEDAKARGMRVLEVLDKDTSSEMKKFIALQSRPDEQLQGRGYDSLDDVHTNHPNTIYAVWTKTDCDKLDRLPKSPAAK
jgi:hypothetical protein